MALDRRGFVKTLSGAALAATWNPRAIAGAAHDYEAPLLDLAAVSKTPVKIASLELLRRGSNYFVRAASSDGVVGVAPTKQVDDYIPILLRRVFPFFVGKDARDLEGLVDGVYRQNYKMAGQAFWAPVAYTEQALLDLLGKTANKSVGALLGGVIRKQIPVYLSGSVRETKAEEEVEIYAQGLERTGAKAAKFKIGGRMSSNADAYPGRTETMVRLARKRLGDGAILSADANGSYDAARGLEVARMLRDLKYEFFEEPCPWEEKSETKKVAAARVIKIAFGEQDSSLWMFQWMIDNHVMDIVQPDLNYNGGFIRAARVARMARKAGMTIVPHNTQTGAASANILQFASAIPNIGPRMEYPWRQPLKPESWYTPQFEIRGGTIQVSAGPGLGLEIDPSYLASATRVQV